MNSEDEEQNLLLTEFRWKKIKPSIFILSIAGSLFGLFALFALAEMILAFIANTHIFGFIVGLIQFATCIILVIILVIYYRKLGLQTWMWKALYVLSAVSVLGFVLVLCFLCIKIMNFSQPPLKRGTVVVNTEFNKECLDAINLCSKTTPQSRIKYSATFDKDQGHYYVQTSHTDWFLGFITDGLYEITVEEKEAEGKEKKCFTENNEICVYATCYKRISAVGTKCGNLWSSFEECLKTKPNPNKQDERWQKCLGNP
ncbi:unnamed protein product [Moneuplotes crassus]|uniref:Uncharacterized protein n=1 Tax=Euplotes crassus TaxID=5936 RepID=A0AAD1XSU7_EUPCR|nr:unnamed protein product [Moneuplotes crassus]